MTKKPPSDRVTTDGVPAKLTGRDRRRLVLMRQLAGAVDIRITVHARPAGSEAWRPIRSGTRKFSAHSAFNAEQLILGGPIAGTTFNQTRDLLEFYEQEVLKLTKENTER
jgi:hypothetical protein